MGTIACPHCGAQVNADASGCPDCGADPKTGVVPEQVEKLFDRLGALGTWPDFTREQLLAHHVVDAGHAANAAYHREGYVWAYDQKLDRERCFRWRAGRRDSLEQGLPVDDEDRRAMLAHEVDPADAPATGWRHFRFCECFICKVHQPVFPGGDASVVASAEAGAALDAVFRQL